MSRIVSRQIAKDKRNLGGCFQESLLLYSLQIRAAPYISRSGDHRSVRRALSEQVMDYTVRDEENMTDGSLREASSRDVEVAAPVFS